MSGGDGQMEHAMDGRVLAAHCRERLISLGHRKLAGRLRVGWNKRLRSTAGRAWIRESWIELNPLLIGHGEDEVRLTLLHELAHLLAHDRHGRKIQPHGPEWRQACADVGIPGAAATHRLPLPRRQVARRYYYECPSCGAGMKRVHRVKREVACLACCRQHSGGSFDKRFVMCEKPL